jgi:hypothetical protein
LERFYIADRSYRVNETLLSLTHELAKAQTIPQTEVSLAMAHKAEAFSARSAALIEALNAAKELAATLGLTEQQLRALLSPRNAFLLTSVSYFPSTPDGMKVVLRNEELVKELSSKGAPIEVTADLYPDPATKSGYKWSSSQGPPTGIFSGTLASAQIVVQRQPPVEFVIPKIKEIMGLK